ncbi:MAG: SUMF1/EgtB/PvdO family nonheme iron enzyme [Pirellulaceae bacterium]|nr:SUMF1/EgtB/PvdO family nonheme iron enzyme [Pirellulaceae bacterium]
MKQRKAELDELARKLRQPPPVDPFQDEPALCRALGWVESIQLSARPPMLQTVSADDLGTLGQYRLLSVLGQGGMGTVYKALHTRLEKIFAVKVLPLDKLQEEQAVARFDREMKAVAKAEHPNIVRATDAGVSDGRHFLVMEYVEGMDLARLLRHIGPLTPGDACELIRQAALGLQYAHSKGMVHRDLKPSNLMLARSEDGPPQVKILDLGLALLDAPHSSEPRELTSTGQVMGTVDYMAPEQIQDSHHVDIRADIYSLGATLYKLLCGQTPFSGQRWDNPRRRMMALVTETPRSIAQRRSDLPDGLPEVVDRMMARNADERYPTPAEVAAALAPFCVGTDLAALLQSAESMQPFMCRDARLPKTKDALSSSSTRKENAAENAADGRSLQPTRVWPRSAFSFRRRLLLLSATVGLTLVLGTARLIRNATDTGGSMRAPLSASGESPLPARAPFDAEQAEAFQQAWAGHLGIEAEISNSVGMRLRLIPPGEFMMGSHDREETYKEDEGPRHRVGLTRPFYLGACEVTQGEYTQVMGINPSSYSAKPGQGQPQGIGEFTTRHPVNCVSWLDAVAFCNKLSEMEGLQPCYAIEDSNVAAIDGNGYRLPTEAEWEYACRAGNESIYSFFDNTQLDAHAWYKANAVGLNRVGQKLANGFGLHDFHGSVAEWCADWWAADYYTVSPEVNPLGPETGEFRVMRGGSWRNGHPPHLRCAHRSHYAPDIKFEYFGFRVAKTLCFTP